MCASRGACIILLIATSLAFAGQPNVRLFRAADESTTIRIFAPDRLELTTKDGPGVQRYSREGFSLRVVVTSLGGVHILMLKMIPIGLVMPDGTTLYDESHFEAGRKGCSTSIVSPSLGETHARRSLRTSKLRLSSLRRLRMT
jgi:hypothetical protein